MNAMRWLTRFPIYAVVMVLTLCAQTPAFESLEYLRQELQTTVQSGDLVKAADLAVRCGSARVAGESSRARLGRIRRTSGTWGCAEALPRATTGFASAGGALIGNS